MVGTAFVAVQCTLYIDRWPGAGRGGGGGDPVVLEPSVSTQRPTAAPAPLSQLPRRIRTVTITRSFHPHTGYTSTSTGTTDSFMQSH